MRPDRLGRWSTFGSAGYDGLAGVSVGESPIQMPIEEGSMVVTTTRDQWSAN